MTRGNARFVFIHVPRTGGTWARLAMEAAGIEASKLGEGHHPMRDELDIDGRFTFGFVREPLSWYGSEWSYRRWLRTTGLEEMNHFYDPWLDLDFPEFLARVMDERPGFLSWFYETYVGPPDDPIDFIGRFETLVDDLAQALTMAGQSFDEEALRSFEPVNRSDPAPPCPSELKQRLRHVERDAYERFYLKPAAEPIG
jgi:hypothetical protein